MKKSVFLLSFLLVLIGALQVPVLEGAVVGDWEDLPPEQLSSLEPQQQESILNGTAFMEGLGDLPEVAKIDRGPSKASPENAALLTHPVASEYDPVTGRIATTYLLPDETYSTVTRDSKGKFISQKNYAGKEEWEKGILAT